MLGRQQSLYNSCKINFNTLKQNVKILLGDNKKVLDALQVVELELIKVNPYCKITSIKNVTEEENNSPVLEKENTTDESKTSN